ncbi:MAG: AAA family ATPase [Gammaproteobacteria bacterium]|nr:AAA family ATPase [Gammaproteobacteria bacterium]
MIEGIRIKSVASFGDTEQIIDGLSNNNFFYGSNGSGKTTISRVIADEDEYSECSVIWHGGNKLQTLVYNRDFVDKNFNSDAELKGIFTLGEKNEADLKAIEDAKTDADKLEADIQGKKKTLAGDDGTGGKEAELAALENEFEGQCWTLKGKYDEGFKEAFKGVRDKKAKFKTKLLAEVEGNKADLQTLEELKTKCATVFADNLEKMNSIPPLLYSDLVDLETVDILTKKVIGKDDVDIAAMIKKLGNSDWVKQGRAYYDENNDICPFCQQDTDEAFAESLNKYFDETYLNDLGAIDQLATNYEAHSTTIVQRLQSIVDAAPQYLDCEKLDSQKSVVETKISANKQHIGRKKKEASLVVELESLKETLDEISLAIKSANEEIALHNKTVDNIGQEKRTLTSQIWKYVIEEAKPVYDSYTSRKTPLEAAISSLSKGIADKKAEKKIKIDEIRVLEKNITSIQPTVDEINALLSSFGFTGFNIAKSQKDGYYSIVRPDGSEAKETLSEGERSFVTFLYFYHLLKGSTSESGMTENRVVVIDDPVSSLDSDILFIVSNLIKRLFGDIRSGTGYIKQVFVLTHNVYFHKEITFNQKRTDGAMSEETFWIVKKIEQYSSVEKHSDNPVKTSYQLLWNEVKDEKRSILTIQNTLRRILENYFKILGNINNDKIVDMFEGKEKQVCGSLFSWVNDGSHFALDDLYVSCDAAMVDTYLAVFKKIFEKSGHIAHYNMMKGQEMPDEANDNPKQVVEVA